MISEAAVYIQKKNVKIVKKSLKIASDICVYTNGNHVVETIEY